MGHSLVYVWLVIILASDKGKKTKNDRKLQSLVPNSIIRPEMNPRLKPLHPKQKNRLEMNPRPEISIKIYSKLLNTVILAIKLATIWRFDPISRHFKSLGQKCVPMKTRNLKYDVTSCFRLHYVSPMYRLILHD